MGPKSRSGPVGSGPVRLSQTRPIPRSPDGDKNHYNYHYNDFSDYNNRKSSHDPRHRRPSQPFTIHQIDLKHLYGGAPSA